MWKVTKEIIFISLGYNYYIVKFYKEENLEKKCSNSDHGSLMISFYS